MRLFVQRLLMFGWECRRRVAEDVALAKGEVSSEQLLEAAEAFVKEHGPPQSLVDPWVVTPIAIFSSGG